MTDVAGARARRSWLPWAVGGGVVVAVLIVGGAVFALSGSDDDPASVREVADQAVAAAQDLDVDAGIDLLCKAHSGDDRHFLDSAIDAARTATGQDAPDARYDVSNLEGSTTGSFDVTITSGDPALEGVVGAAHVKVGRDGDRSCIASFEDTSISQDGSGEYVVD
jgi:hypothetical protein